MDKIVAFAFDVAPEFSHSSVIGPKSWVEKGEFTYSSAADSTDR